MTCLLVVAGSCPEDMTHRKRVVRGCQVRLILIPQCCWPPLPLYHSDQAGNCRKWGLATNFQQELEESSTVALSPSLTANGYNYQQDISPGGEEAVILFIFSTDHTNKVNPKSLQVLLLLQQQVYGAI